MSNMSWGNLILDENHLLLGIWRGKVILIFIVSLITRSIGWDHFCSFLLLKPQDCSWNLRTASETSKGLLKPQNSSWNLRPATETSESWNLRTAHEINDWALNSHFFKPMSTSTKNMKPENLYSNSAYSVATYMN